MAIKKALWSLSGAVALLGIAGSPALAGHTAGPVPTCGGSPCAAGIAIMPAPPGHSGPMTVQNRTPYDFMDSVHFQRSPHISITRIHGMLPSAGISDAPSGFTGGCHPESTTYCRTNGLSAAPRTTQTFKAPAPTPVAPSPQPWPQISTPPVITAPPVIQERVVAIGGGFDPSKFQPRIYGDPYTITPGIAHVPTSIVDRDPYRAQQVLDSGRAVYNPWTPGGVTPAFAGVPVNTTPVPPPLPPHYAPRGGHVSGYATGYTSGYSASAGYSVPAPTHFAAPPVVSGPAPHVQGRYGTSSHRSVTCNSGGRYPHPPAPTSPCALAKVKTRY